MCGDAGSTFVCGTSGADTGMAREEERGDGGGNGARGTRTGRAAHACQGKWGLHARDRRVRMTVQQLAELAPRVWSRFRGGGDRAVWRSPGACLVGRIVAHEGWRREAWPCSLARGRRSPIRRWPRLRDWGRLPSDRGGVRVDEQRVPATCGQGSVGIARVGPHDQVAPRRDVYEVGRSPGPGARGRWHARAAGVAPVLPPARQPVGHTP